MADFWKALNESVTAKDEKIKQLKQQIEKMKCCGNCKHYYCSNDTKGKCNLKNPKENKCGFNICEKWEV